MSDDIDLLIENTGNARLLSEVQLPSLLGRYIEGIDMDVMTDMWVIAGTAINEMYNRTEKAKVRAGIGYITVYILLSALCAIPLYVDDEYTQLWHNLKKLI